MTRCPRHRLLDESEVDLERQHETEIDQEFKDAQEEMQRVVETVLRIVCQTEC